jgi:glycosyltransferase involved in cell wall biosynthesis
LIRNNSYEALISVAHPFSSHVVAFFAKKKNIGHKWICDYGDPFSVDEITPSNNFTLYRSLNRWIEKKIIISSKNISVTTQRTIDLYVNGLSVPQEMFTVINPLFSFNEKNDYSDSVSDTIQFIFSGTLYKKIRNPSFLIQLISKLRQALPKKNIELHFYGKLNDCYDEFEPYMSAMNKWLFIHGEVERAALYMSYSASSVLVNIGNATNFQVPSKIIEYMSTGLPILNIYSSSVDTSYSFLERYPAKLSVSANLPDINESIQQLVNFLEKVYIVEHSLLQDIMAEYQIDTVSGKYLQMMA